MDIRVDGTTILLILSRKNLTDLVAKLDEQPATPVRTMAREMGGFYWIIHVEPDAVHYKDRPDDSEQFLKVH